MAAVQRAKPDGLAGLAARGRFQVITVTLGLEAPRGHLSGWAPPTRATPRPPWATMHFVEIWFRAGLMSVNKGLARLCR